MSPWTSVIAATSRSEPRGLGERDVEADVRAAVHVEARHLGHLLHARAHPVEVASPRPLGGQHRGAHLDRHAVVEHGAHSSGRAAGAPARRQRRRLGHEGPAGTPAHRGEVPALDQRDDGLAQRRAGDAELGGQLALGRQAGARPSRPSLIAFPSRSTVSSNVVGGETGSNTAATASLLSIGQRYPLRAIRRKSGATVVHIGRQRSDHGLQPGALVVARAAQAPACPLDHVVAPAHGQGGAGDRVAAVREDGKRSGVVTADAQDVRPPSRRPARPGDPGRRRPPATARPGRSARAPAWAGAAGAAGRSARRASARRARAWPTPPPGGWRRGAVTALQARGAARRDRLPAAHDHVDHGIARSPTRAPAPRPPRPPARPAPPPPRRPSAGRCRPRRADAGTGRIARGHAEGFRERLERRALEQGRDQHREEHHVEELEAVGNAVVTGKVPSTTGTAPRRPAHPGHRLLGGREADGTVATAAAAGARRGTSTSASTVPFTATSIELGPGTPAAPASRTGRSAPTQAIPSWKVDRPSGGPESERYPSHQAGDGKPQGTRAVQRPPAAPKASAAVASEATG